MSSARTTTVLKGEKGKREKRKARREKGRETGQKDDALLLPFSLLPSPFTYVPAL
jgi:hypothetical protein